MKSGGPHPDSGRRQERVTVDISVRIAKSEGALTFGRAHDVSSTGMSVYVPVEFAVGDQIRIDFTLPSSRLKMKVEAVVKNRMGFRYGVAFANLTQEESAEIARVTGILALTQA